MRSGAPALLLLALLSGCGGGPAAAPTAGPSATPSTTPTPSSSPTSASASPTPSTPSPRRPVLGVDASHHQGSIDWTRVAGDGISFAYLKATEGSGFTDPRFADNLAGAQRAGLRAGGYHYFTLCGAGAPQADHYLSVLGRRTTLPPAVDVEVIGNCSPGPPRADLLRELRAFIDRVESATRKRVVVYLYPEIEEHYRLAAKLDRRQWVRRLGDRPPSRPWYIWQKSDSARIAGIEGPADLNQLAPGAR